MHHDDPPFDDDEAEEQAFGGMNAVSVVLPFAATVVSLVFGMFIGGAAVWIVKPVQRPIEYMKTASLAELQLVCEPVVEETKSQLVRVKGEITDLKDTVRQKEAIVAQLQEQLDAQKGTGGDALKRELQRARGKLTKSQQELEVLMAVKDQLVDQLTKAQERLAETEADLQAQAAITEVLRDENVDLKDDVVVQRWFRMITEAQLDICDRVGKRKYDKCREAVVGALSTVRREFVHCIRSKQAVPAVEQVQKGRALPHFARMLDQDNKFLEGHYLQMCDPTLPEVEL